ncbi:hypothetical protein GCM10027596_32910 [Nocardioides korecus]
MNLRPRTTAPSSASTTSSTHRPSGRPDDASARRRVRHPARGPARTLVLVLLACLLGLAPLVLASQASAAPITIKAAADSYVRSDTPDANYGSKYVLATSALSATTPTSNSYLRFDVSGLTGAPAKVVLRLYSYAASTTGVQVSTSSSSWTESGITFTNAPGVGSTVGTMSNLAVNAWSELDVTSAITGNGSYTLVVTTTSTANKQLASRESTATPPQLVVDPGTTATPTPTPTTTPTPTVTSTPTASSSPPVTSTPTPTTTASTTPSSTASASSSPTTTASAGTGTATFTPQADASVRSDQPDTNAGGAFTLFEQAPSSTGPEQRSYLKVTVSGLTAPVTAASLQLYSYSTSTEGVDVSLSDSSWTETGLTWNNAPPVGVRAGKAAPVTVSTWGSADVTSAITGNGTYTFVLTTTRTSANKVASREATGSSPRLVVSTGGSTTSPTPTPTSSPTTTSPGSGDPTLVAAGDIACPDGKAPTSTSCQQQATSDLAVSLKPTALLPLGDNTYELGALSDYQASYAPSWGRLDSIAHPVPGNHEYGYIGSSIQPTGGVGYFAYFGTKSHPLAPGCTSSCPSWYSYDVGAWHLVALDSQCGVVGGCNPGNPEYQWLLNDLNTHPNTCTLAYWHIPVFSSSQDHQPDMSAIFKLLYDKGADVVLNGHAHFYERFAPQDVNGVADPARGIRELLVGTGGRSFFAVRATPAANSEARIANTFGVLQMTLHPTSYDFRFVPVAGSTATDAGSGTCH